MIFLYIPFILFLLAYRIVNNIADLFYHAVSGCMTAQVSFEMDYQNSLMVGNNMNNSSAPVIATAVPADYNKY